MDCRFITAPAEFLSLRGRWNELVRRHPRPEVFYLHEWPSASLASEDALLFVPSAWEGDRFLGALPLARRDGRLHFIAEDYADYNDLVCDPDSCAEVARCLFDALWKASGAWRSLDLANVREDALLKEALRRDQDLGRSLREIRAQQCPYIDLSNEKEERLRALCRKKSLMRHRKALARSGDLAFVVFRDYEAVRPWLEEFHLQHIVRRAVAGGRSNFAGARHREMIRGLLQTLGPDVVRFAALTVDGRAAAFHLGFVFAEKYYWYKPSFDVDLWSQSPGEALLLSLFESLAQEPVRQFDFTIGDESFKQRFADGSTHTSVLRTSRSDRVLVPVLRTARRIPGMAGLGRRLSSLAGSMRLRWRNLFGRAAALTRSLARSARHPREMGRRALRALYAKRRVLVFEADPAAVAAPAPADWRIVTNRVMELARHGLRGEIPYAGARLKEAAERRRRGDEVCLLVRDGKALHVSWAGRRREINPRYELGCDLRTECPDEPLMIYDCWTGEDARGQGLYPRMLRCIAHAWRDRVSRLLIYCAADNPASIRGIRKAGFKPAFEMRVTLYFRFFKRREILFP